MTRANQVHVMFRAKLREPKFAAGPESLEVALYEEAQIPWTELAFASGEYALRQYFADRSAGREDHHFTELKEPHPPPVIRGRIALVINRVREG